MPEETSKITIIADLLKRDPAYKEVIDQLEERLYNRYMVYLADKPRFNAKASAIPKQYLAQILSFKNTLELNKIAKKYNLSQDQRDAMPAVLWKIFLREAEIKNLPQILNGELGLNNIRVAYQMALDIAPIYMPISDYLGDLGMVMKRWQYEMPAEPATSYQPSAISQSQPQAQKGSPTSNLPGQTDQTPPSVPSAPAVPPIPHPSGIAQGANYSLSPKGEGDEPIARVQETMARISGQMAKIQSPSVIPARQQADETPAGIQPKSDVEPEYLPDAPPTHSANIIDLKNF